MIAILNMPPRWGLGFIADVACYKHVAPLALVRRAETDLRESQMQNAETRPQCRLEKSMSRLWRYNWTSDPNAGASTPMPARASGRPHTTPALSPR